MNKKQWNALGGVFILAIVLFSLFFLGTIRSFAMKWSVWATMSGASSETLIAANIQDAMYTLLSWLGYILCFIFAIMAIACWICGWLEKEEAR